MPFDDNMLLLDGSSALRHDRYTAPTDMTTGAYGGYVVDLYGTASKGMCAVMVAGQLNQTYKGLLEGWIEVSDNMVGNWERIASFPKLYQWRRRCPAKTTTAPVHSDIGKYLYGGSTTDDGIIISFDAGLYTASTGTGNIYVAMNDSAALFDNSTEAYTVSAEAANGGAAGTFVGVSTAASTLLPGGGILVCRFATKRRYARFNLDIDANFQRVMVALTPYPFGNDYHQS